MLGNGVGNVLDTRNEVLVSAPWGKKGQLLQQASESEPNARDTLRNAHSTARDN